MRNFIHFVIDLIPKSVIIKPLPVNSETFSILQSLCRVGLGFDNAAFRHQVVRLKEAFKNEGDKEKESTFERLLTGAGRSAEFRPSKVAISRAFPGTEALLPNTSPPSDRETGAALAEIIFPPKSCPEFPVLDNGPKEALEAIIEEWKNVEKLLAAGVSPPSTCLFYGPPGTGKTRIAFALAATLELPIVLTRLDGVISSFLGTTGRNVANLFAFANRYKCVLLLDEFDAIAKVRDDPHEVGEIKRVVNAILQNIDLRRNSALTIATTNHESLLDPAVWRRFDVRISIPCPGFIEREAIVKRYFIQESLDEITVKLVAWLTEGMTGADIEVMSKNVRRHRALHSESPLLSSLKHFSTTQAGRTTFRHESILGGTQQDLARALHSAPELNFTQMQIGKLLGVSQTQVARWLKPPPTSK